MLTHITHPLDPCDIEPCAAFRKAGASRKGIALGPEARPMFDAMRGTTSIADGVTIEAGEAGGVAGLWCRIGPSPTQARLLFLHGGGYMLGSAAAMTGFASQLAVRSGADAFVADYRLAPEHAFPAAFDDALAAYLGLAASAEGPIVIAGESAGGGLALAVLAALTDMPEVNKPVAAAVMSPWTDLTLSGGSYETRAGVDPIFTRETLGALADTYLQGQAATDARCSPLLGAMTPIPTHIDVGGDEVLLDDAMAYATLASDAGAAVTLEVWEGVPHVFQARVNDLATAKLSFDAAGAFIAAYIRPRQAVPTNEQRNGKLGSVLKKYLR